MEFFKKYSKLALGFAVLALVVFITGCGGGGGGSANISGSGPATTSSKALVTYSVGGALGVVDETAKTVTVTVPNGTNLTALAATFTTTGASAAIGAVTQVSGTTTNNFTTSKAYIVTATDGTTATYTVTVTAAAATAKAITAYSLAGVAGVINEAAKTIHVTVPNGTVVTSLAATFATTGTGVAIGGTAQVSGTTTNNFTTSKAYVVTAGDASAATYTVTVTVASGTAKAITAFSFAGYPGATGVINEAQKKIAVTVPFGTDKTALVATYNSTGANVKIGTTVQTSATTANNFTNPVAYIVTAADASTATYTVTVTTASNTASAITAFSVAGATGSIVGTNIAVAVPFGTTLTALVATYTTTGASVKVSGVTQTSSATANDFTGVVSYLVTAADGITTTTYAVTVTAAANSAKAITAYSFAGLPDSVGVITEPAHTIVVSVLPGTDKTALIASYTTTGTSVSVLGALQTSGATPNNFSVNPVIYTVNAADASSVTYDVNITEGAGPTPVNLRTAGDFAVLTKAGVTTTAGTMITGDMGVSPIAATAMTGFTLTADSTNTFATSPLVTGKVYAANYAAPTPANMTQAVSDMETAYTDAAGRTAGVGANLDLGTGTLNGNNLAPGTYTWGTGVTVTGNITLTGGANDVWLFQVGGTFDLATGTSIILAGGAQAKNIFWQISGATTLQANSVFNGIILAQTNVAMITGAALNGRVLAQTAATLQSNAITQP